MDTPEIKSFAKYNLWANQELVKTLEQLDDQQIDQEIINSFPSIEKTFTHIWLAEYLWLERWQGNSPKSFLHDDFSGSHKERFAAILATSTAVREYVAGLTTEDLEAEITIYTLAGTEYRHSRYQMIHHCLNHSTYHRGQIVMMCKQLGVQELGPFDYIWYLRIQQNSPA